MKTPHKRHRGYTLIEVLIALGAILTLSGFVGYYAWQVRRSNQVEAFVDQYGAMAEALRARYRGQGDYAGLTFKSARLDGLIPPGFLSANSIAIGSTPWGTTLDVSPAAAESDARAANQSFMTTVSIPDPDLCLGVLMAMAGRVQRIRVGTSIYLTLEPFQGTVSVTSQQNAVRNYCTRSQIAVNGPKFYLYDN
ncbi:MAG TPA: type II secretion system protein [Rhodanobacteraceae bacterium]|nr:type II secretion system protein [Rhodanobacteraceae bacterium]